MKIIVNYLFFSYNGIRENLTFFAERKIIMRRYAAISCLCFLLVLGSAWVWGGVVLPVALLLAFPVILWKSHGRALLRCLLCGILCAAAVFAGYTARFKAAESLCGEEVPFEGVVLEVSPYSAHRYTVYAEIEGRHRILVLNNYLEQEDTALAGERVSGTVLLTGAAPEDDTVLLSGGVALTGQQTSMAPPKEKRSLICSAVLFRREAIRRFSALGGGEAGSIALGMLTSDLSELPAALRSDFAAAGISHLLAVSGLHLSILAAVALAAGRLLLLSRRARAWLALCCCILMALLAGFSASVLRAGLMTALLLFGEPFGRQGDGLTSLGIAAALLAVLNPAVVESLSYWLTCTATLGILLLAGPLTRLLPLRKPFPRLLWETICVTLAAQIGTLPVTALTFGYLPAYSILTNLCILPLVYLTLIGGLLTLPPLFLGFGAAVPHTLACMGAAGIRFIAGAFAQLPGATLSFTRPWQLLTPGILLVVLLFLLCTRRKRKRLIILMAGCILTAASLVFTAPLSSITTIAVDEVTGSVLLSRGKQTLLLEGTSSGYEANAISRFLLQNGSPALTVLVHPAIQHDLTQELRLARLLEPEILLADPATQALGKGQLPDLIQFVPDDSTPCRIFGDITIFNGENPITILQIGSQKVLKCWAGYGIITESDIPPDACIIIDRTGKVWQQEGSLPCRHWGTTTILMLPEE